MMKASLLLAAALAAGCQVNTTDNFVNPPPGPPADCTAIASLPGCDGGSLSFACATDRPDDGDANLVCSDGSPGGGDTTLYCCAPYVQMYSDCAPDPALAACGGVAIAFACTGGDDAAAGGATGPSDADPAIACSAAISDGDTQHYCCNTAAVPATCAIDPTIECVGVAVGYSCVTGDAPFADTAVFTCAAQPTTGGSTGYCCVPTM